MCCTHYDVTMLRAQLFDIAGRHKEEHVEVGQGEAPRKSSAEPKWLWHAQHPPSPRTQPGSEVGEDPTNSTAS